MTPEARVAAAIDILDAILAGRSAEQTLTNWARNSRFAGARDRAAVRDLVFDAIRCKRSFAWRGGAETGRGLMLGRSFAQEEEPDAVFTGQGYGPSQLTDAERKGRSLDDAPDTVRLDCPDWLWPELNDSLADDVNAIMGMLQTRAPLFLRANVRKGTRADAIESLAVDGILAVPHGLSETALEVIDNPRKVRTSRAFLEGLVEVQDVASQAVVDALAAASDHGRVLDYCAGGGGKSLALAALGYEVTAHDIDPNRMKDIPERAARAGATIALTSSPSGTFDIVLCDAPCSGSGAWRRQPEAKWILTAERLAELHRVQAGILESAMELVAEGGLLAYATCSLLDSENDSQVSHFLAKNALWAQKFQKKFTPLDGGDGFFITGLKRLN